MELLLINYQHSWLDIAVLLMYLLVLDALIQEYF